MVQSEKKCSARGQGSSGLVRKFSREALNVIRGHMRGKCGNLEGGQRKRDSSSWGQSPEEDISRGKRGSRGVRGRTKGGLYRRKARSLSLGFRERRARGQTLEGSKVRGEGSNTVRI